MHTRKLTLSRFLVPLLAAGALYSIEAVVAVRPLMRRGADIRPLIFGPNLAYLRFAAAFAAIIFVVRVLDALIFDLFAPRRRHVVAPAMLREIVSIGLYAFLIAWAFTTIFNRPLTAILATTTVVAAVIGLALQDTLGNLFSGISLHMEGTFEVGDVVRAGGHAGLVESVSWRATRLRTPNNNIIVVPNSVLSKETLEVYPRKTLNARTVQVGVAYEARPARVIAILEAAARRIEGVSAEVPCFARISGFGDSAVTYEVKYWTNNYHARDNIDADIRKAIWYALRRNEISIPYPIRSLHVLESKPEDTPLEEQDVFERLQEIDVLAPLSNEELAAIANDTTLRMFGRGETIIHAGQTGDSMFIVHRGEVSVRLPERPQEEVARLAAGAVFGEMALLTGEQRTADVLAATDVAVLEIGKSAVEPVLRQNPDLAAAISAKMIERRGTLERSRKRADADEQRTLIDRIRSYFGL